MLGRVCGCRGLQLQDGGHICKAGVEFGNLAQRCGGVAAGQLLQQRQQRLCGSPSQHTHPVGVVLSAASIQKLRSQVAGEDLHIIPAVEGCIDGPNKQDRPI